MADAPAAVCVLARVAAPLAARSREAGSALDALLPLANRAFGDRAESVLAEITAQFNARCAKLGLAVQE